MIGQLTPGKEVDSRCTRCKRVTGHIIVIMSGATPTRVKCNSCGSEHKYREPVPEKAPTRQRTRAVLVRTSDGRKREIRGTTKAPEVKAKPGRPRRKSTTDKKSPRRSSDPLIRFAEQCEGKELGRPRPYGADQAFAIDDLLVHPGLGLGIVTKVRGGKVDVLFRSGGEKTLVHATS